MKCFRCNTTLIRMPDNPVDKKITERLGVEYLGKWVCKKCYPDKGWSK